MLIDTVTVQAQPSQRRNRLVRRLTLLAADLAAMGFSGLAAFWAANQIRPFFGMGPIGLTGGNTATVALITCGILAVLLLWFQHHGHYRQPQGLENQVREILAGSLMGLLVAATALFAADQDDSSRLLTFSYWFILAPSLLLFRLLARRVLSAAGQWSRPAALFVAGSRRNEIDALIARNQALGMSVAGVHQVAGDDLFSIFEAMQAAQAREELIVFAPDAGFEAEPLLKRLVDQGWEFHYAPPNRALPMDVDRLSFPPADTVMMEVHDPLDRPVAMAVKRVFDIVVAGSALLFLSPALLYITVSIKRDGGPAIFRQKRLGRHGRAFDCWKFRSMRVDAEDHLRHMIETDPAIAAEWKTYQKLSVDPRITPIGRLIRKINVDEIPQLVNVLKGDMSLIGPRPMTLEQIEEYGPSVDAYIRMRPGITGLWQTNGRNATTFAERARLDAWYVRNWSLWREAVILFRTVREVVLPSGQ